MEHLHDISAVCASLGTTSRSLRESNTTMKDAVLCTDAILRGDYAACLPP